MSTPTESEDKAKRNAQATASLVLGVLSIVLALMTVTPGVLSALGCVAPVAALLAFVAGVRGIRAARELDGQGRKLAIAGMAISGLGLLVFIVLWTFVTQSAQRRIDALLTPQPPQTFQGDGFTLTYPGGWQTLDMSQQAPICGQPGVECPFAISHPSDDGTNINLMRFALEQELTVEEADEVLWAQLESSTPDVILESREAIEIGGQPAIKRVFSMSSSAAPGGRAHILQIYIVEELALFQFTGFAPSVEVFKQHQAEIEEIVISIQFTATPEAPTEVVQTERPMVESLLRPAVNSVAFAPDGETLASGAADDTVRLWQVNDGSLLQALKGHTDQVSSIAFAPDGETLASGSFDYTVRLWRVDDETPLRTLEGHTDQVWSVAFSPDGATLASGSRDGTVRLWRVNDGMLLRTLEGHMSAVLGVAFSLDGETLASGSFDCTVRLWRMSDGTLLRTLEHTEAVLGVKDVAFSPDGATLASGSLDGTVRLWRISDGTLLRTLKGHRGWVTGVAFSLDGATLASGSEDGTVRLWQVEDGTLLRTMEEHTDAVSSVAFSPDGETLASGSFDGTVRLWQVSDGTVLHTLP